MSAIDISVLIVNFNGTAYIDRCFKAIFDSQTTATIEVLVLDNKSADDSLAKLATYGNQITVIKNEENVGFPNGINTLLPHANGKVVFLVNIDAFVEPTTMDHLYNELMSDSTIGAIGPKLLNDDGSLQQQGNNFAKWLYDTDAPKNTRFLSGAVMMMRTDYFRDTMGGFDPNFFFYNDDVDICIRIRRDGKRVVYDPRVRSTHIIGGVSKTVKVKILKEGFRGGFWLVKKHYGPIAYTLYRVGMGLVFSLKALGHGLLSFKQYHRDHVTVCGHVILFALTGDLDQPHRPEHL